MISIIMVEYDFPMVIKWNSTLTHGTLGKKSFNITKTGSIENYLEEEDCKQGEKQILRMVFFLGNV